MDISQVKFDANGLAPAIALDVETGQVVMMAYMNEKSLIQTVETGIGTYWSRSRQKFWVKGESSGHTQEVQWIRLDCDGDTVLLGVKQNGAACHMGYFSCFFRKLVDGEWVITEEKIFDPDATYSK